MSLFSGPTEHAANPPQSWVVVKVGARRWALKTKVGGPTMDTFATKKQAESAKVEGFYVSLYNRESRWYAGEPIPGWKPYSQMSPAALALPSIVAPEES